MVIYEPYPTIPLAQFHSELRFEYPDLPSQLFDYYLVRTAVDMAERGNLLRRRVAIELEPGVTRYALHSPDDLPFWAIMGVRHAPCDSGCGGSRELVRSLTPPDNAVRCTQGDTVWWDSIEQVLHIELCGGGMVYVTMAVVPSRTACELPAVYREKYLEALMVGTRSSIMLITGRPWTNLRLGGQLRTEYLEMVKALSVDAATKQQRGTVRMNFGRVL